MVKNYWLTSLLTVTIALSFSCSNQINNVTETKGNSTITKASFEDDEISCPKEQKTFSAKSDLDLLPIKTEDRGKGKETKEKEQSPYDYQFFDASKKTKIPYSISRKTPDDARTGEVTIIFKDEFQVRLKDNNGKLKPYHKSKDKNDRIELKSLSNDIKDINKLFHDYDIKNIYGSVFDEEKASFAEKKLEEECKCDNSNALSLYSVFIENQNVKEFVDKLRENTLIREANYVEFKTELLDARDEPIFNNNATPLLASNSGTFPITENLRYYYNKTNMLRAYGLVESNNITPPNIAVIDYGFMNDHEDKARTAEMPILSSYLYCTPACTTSFDSSTVEYNHNLPADDSEHGAWVSSVIASKDNGKGVAGYSHKSKVIPVKVDYSLSAIRNAIEYITDHRVGFNTKVINISLGFNTQPIEVDSNIRNSINSARVFGVLVVMAAGNSSVQVLDSNKSEGLVVGGGAKYTNNRASFSNHGGRIDISAPAESIIVPSRYGNNKYELVNGTSFAAPQVASTAALLMGIISRPDLQQWDSTSVDKVKSLIINSAKPIQSDLPLGSGTNFFNIPNGRMLDVNRALEIALQTEANKSYLRLFNTDYYSEVLYNWYPNSGQLPALHNFYKEDKLIEIPTSVNRLDFGTSNLGCVYSWGYQIWKNGQVTFQRIKGIAGKRKPLKVSPNNQNGSVIANDVFNSYINETNSGVGYFDANNYQGADLWTTQTSLWK